MRVRRLDVNHDRTFGQGLSNIAVGAEAVAQRVKTRLYLLLGEWFLDIEAGVPYLQRITTKPSDLFYTESVLRRTILGTEDVSRITSFDMTYNGTTRRLNIATTVTTIYGTLVDIRVDKVI